jgi:hypothetical protein
MFPYLYLLFFKKNHLIHFFLFPNYLNLEIPLSNSLPLSPVCSSLFKRNFGFNIYSWISCDVSLCLGGLQKPPANRLFFAKSRAGPVPFIFQNLVVLNFKFWENLQWKFVKNISFMINFDEKVYKYKHF